MPSATLTAQRPNLALARALGEARVLGAPAYVIAMAAGISPALLSMVLRGRVNVTPDTAHAIATALERPVEELFPET